MKKTLVFYVILIVAGGWTANKFLQRINKSSAEKTRFIELTGNYNDNTALFLTEKAKLHHDEAFDASYIIWILSPMSELDLASRYDEKTYYRTLSKLIGKAAKKEGQKDASAALLDIAKHYGIEDKSKKSTRATPPRATSPRTTSPQPQGKKDSLLKSGKLGEKRTIPSSRRRDHDR